jgi:hypothetical protein
VNPANLYVLFYRRGVKGATSGFITASSLKVAEALGQHYCDSALNCRFIRVEPAVIADESSMPDHLKTALGIAKTPPVADPASDKKK